MNFEFFAPRQLVFGPGTLRRAGELVRGWGRRALVVTGRNPARAGPLLLLLESEGIQTAVFPVGSEPTTTMVREGTAQAVEMRADLVVGFGGGSALDAAKAVAALASNGGDPLDYMEVVGRGLPLSKPSLPLLAIPTTAGTGSEATKNAVLASPEHGGVKASLRSLGMIPRLALVDPELTHGMPPEVTAATGLDALTQLIEPFTCNRPNPIVDGLCREGIARVARSLRRAWADGRDAAAREDMALASLYGGLALANAGLGAVHGFAGVAGGMFQAPHGAVCAALLPNVMAMNRAALQAREPGNPALARYGEVARLLTGRADARAEEGVEWVRELTAALGVPGLGAHGIARGDISGIVEKAAGASGTKANPVELTRDELVEILAQAI
jgi:alcohol dehydrogenase class IV